MKSEGQKISERPPIKDRVLLFILLVIMISVLVVFIGMLMNWGRGPVQKTNDKAIVVPTPLGGFRIPKNWTSDDKPAIPYSHGTPGPTRTRIPTSDPTK